MNKLTSILVLFCLYSCKRFECSEQVDHCELSNRIEPKLNHICDSIYLSDSTINNPTIMIRNGVRDSNFVRNIIEFNERSYESVKYRSLNSLIRKYELKMIYYICDKNEYRFENRCMEFFRLGYELDNDTNFVIIDSCNHSGMTLMKKKNSQTN